MKFCLRWNAKITRSSGTCCVAFAVLVMACRLCYAHSMQNKFFVSVSTACFFLLGCGDAGMEGNTETPSPYACNASAPPTRTVSCVESFEPGDANGFGADQYPEIIYGEPHGNGDTHGSTDVLSLGRNGSIAVGFSGNHIVDGPGVDFIVFENPFRYGTDGMLVFSELGEVSVSSDGQTWMTFPCAANDMPPKGCAGYGTVFANGDLNISSTDPAVAGGDQFDLASIGVTEARFVRIRDVSDTGGAPTAGFDLDAVAIVNAKVP